VKLRRDVSGTDIARLLRRFGGQVTRQSGSHMRITANLRGVQHYVTIPTPDSLRVGTLSQILKDVAQYLDLPRDKFVEERFSDR
jgi:predicted RNA binding protein YcfA (HicA-like mRNA interferase family)